MIINNLPTFDGNYAKLNQVNEFKQQQFFNEQLNILNPSDPDTYLILISPTSYADALSQPGTQAVYGPDNIYYEVGNVHSSLVFRTDGIHYFGSGFLHSDNAITDNSPDTAFATVKYVKDSAGGSKLPYDLMAEIKNIRGASSTEYLSVGIPLKIIEEKTSYITCEYENVGNITFFSGNINEFTGNILKLSPPLGYYFVEPNVNFGSDHLYYYPILKDMGNSVTYSGDYNSNSGNIELKVPSKNNKIFQLYSSGSTTSCRFRLKSCIEKVI